MRASGHGCEALRVPFPPPPLLGRRPVRGSAPLAAARPPFPALPRCGASWLGLLLGIELPVFKPSL